LQSWGAILKKRVGAEKKKEREIEIEIDKQAAVAWRRRRPTVQ
jgi:hypothetical protein